MGSCKPPSPGPQLLVVVRVPGGWRERAAPKGHWDQMGGTVA